MGTLTSVAFAAAINIRFREKIKATVPKVVASSASSSASSSWRDRYCFSCRDRNDRFRDFPSVAKCLSNDEQNDNGGENGDTHSSLGRDSTVKTAARDEEDETSSDEFGSDKTPRVHAYL